MLNGQSMRAAYMGEVGSQSNLAAGACFPDFELEGCKTFKDVVAAVAENKVDYGLLALESLTAGRVNEVHLLLRLLSKQGISLQGEYISPVNHHLAIHKDAVEDDIKVVCSHPQALLQCSKFIEQKGWIPQNMADTASAAKRVSESTRLDIAAICSAAASKAFGLRTLHSAIQDNDVNATVFVIIGKSAIRAQADCHLSATEMQSTLLLTLRNTTGSLHKALGCFADHDIDVVRIESYIKGCPTETGVVLLSVEGDLKSGHGSEALRCLQDCTSEIEILGTYPAATERKLDPVVFRETLCQDLSQ